MTILELNFQRRKAKTEAVGLLDKAVTESRTLTTAEQIRFDTLTARIHEMDAAIVERESLRKLVD
ncbi:MAG TPA: hypothetical protein VHX37_13855 [Acidobacteriaceae bacterium]|nr:hypothetical protein [Acidobacteriaceae bacterium]